MAQDALSALDTAIAQLENELQSDPRFALLTQLHTARSSFNSATQLEGPAAASTLFRPALLPRDEKPNLSPGRAKAFELCKKALEGQNEPVRTRDLYEMIEANGVNLAGGQNNLSSFLARHPQTFKGYGRAGWTLKNVGNGAEPSATANGEGPAPLISPSQEGGDGHDPTSTHH